jgi:hypothetical protein
LVAARQPLSAHPLVIHWTNIVEGIQTIQSDVLAEATGATLRNGEPGLSYIRTALVQGMHVVTSSKGPMALAGLELLSLARAQGVQLRMESTVMSGTPVLSTIREGMAGTRIRAIRGILNGTVNFILSAMAMGQDYAEALAQAQALGCPLSSDERKDGQVQFIDKILRQEIIPESPASQDQEVATILLFESSNFLVSICEPDDTCILPGGDFLRSQVVRNHDFFDAIHQTCDLLPPRRGIGSKWPCPIGFEAEKLRSSADQPGISSTQSFRIKVMKMLNDTEKD